MDNLTCLIADYASGLTFDELPEEVIHAATQRIVDSLACAIGAYECEPARIGLRLARGAAPQRHFGRILGFGERSTAEDAAFVNTAMIRTLDFNDQYPGGHPSDCLGAFLALVEAAGADGRRLLSSMVVAYELFVRFNDATGLRVKGWDQGFVIGICTAAGLGHLLRLSPKVLREAIAITVVSNVPMRNTRAGELSLWKGAATAFSTRNAVFATLLAAEGMTGPDRPFEGKHGLWDLITGPFELAAFGGRGGLFRTPDVQLKYWPVEYNAQLVVWAALELRSLVDWRDLAEIDIGTYAFAFSEIGSEPEKWDPKTRETADHSLPYIFARTLVDGTINLAAFEEPAYRDESLRPLMNKIRVRRDETVDAIYPETVSIRVEATTNNGWRYHLEPRDPLGHNKNPMQDKDINDKFVSMAEPVLGQERTPAALERWWNLRDLLQLSEALALLDMDSAAGRGAKTENRAEKL
ncbi:MAG: MmgE/PrpD family protein [Deltaproteobacteria bacterium]|nr:MmgE/PrpD family protein [Deltaproteobacteria bacterium]